jgi:hypothetical protein
VVLRGYRDFLLLEGKEEAKKGLIRATNGEIAPPPLGLKKRKKIH